MYAARAEAIAQQKNWAATQDLKSTTGGALALQPLFFLV
jgi:hypothetical protein